MKITAKNIEKTFGSNQVLFDANIEILPGTVHALMGENGAGKSTLMNIISGTINFDKGTIKFDGVEVNPVAKPDDRISFIRQELNLIKDMQVYENIFLGQMKGFFVDKKAYIKKARDLFTQLGIDLDPTRYIKELSIAEQQLVEIAKGLLDSCEVLIMDEPTAALSEVEIKSLFKIIDGLKKQGVAIIYISHRMNEIFEISDTITVMRDGVYIDSFDAKTIDEDKLISSMVGRDIEKIEKKAVEQKGDVVLRVENISNAELGFKNISFDVKEGEVVSLCGLMGSKRTEVLQAIFNMAKCDTGKVLYYNEEIQNKNIRNCIDKGIAFVTEDRKDSGLFLDYTISNNIGVLNPHLVSKKGVLNFKKEKELSEYFIERLNIKCDSYLDKVSALSGGNQQKVVLSKWLASMPKLLMLDEPTRGIDIRAKQEIYALIKTLTDSNVAVILVSSEMSEVLQLADNIVVLNEGNYITTVQNNELTEEKLLDYMIGAN